MREFSVIELMITRVLAVIILALGMPSLRNVIRNNRAAMQTLAGGSTLTGRAGACFRRTTGGVAVEPWCGLVRQS